MNNFLRLRSSEKAVAAIEFALIFPVLILILYGVIEVTRYIYFSQKVDSASAQISNLINQNSSLSDQATNNVFNAAGILMEPFDSSNLTMIVTSFTMKTALPTDTNITVNWQKIRGKSSVRSLFAPNGNCGASSTKPGCKVTVPPTSFGIPAMNFSDKDQIVVVEIFSGYKSLFMGSYFNDIIDPDAEFYSYTIARPRYGSLIL